MEYENYTFVEALKYLADRAGVELPEEEYSREAKERAEEQMRQKQSIQEYYHSRASLSRALTRLKATSKYQ